MASNEDYKAKVEFIGDGTVCNIDSAWVRDLDEESLPAFEALRVYRGFWSPLAEDSPERMLERAPCVPDLTEEEEKLNKPGYYRVHVLKIAESLAALEESRSRKSTNRGKGSTKGSSKKKVREEPNPSKHNKSRATRANLSNSRTPNLYVDLDKEQCGRTSGEDSDDSTSDCTLVPDAQVKVLTSSIRNLKKKMLEKCNDLSQLESKLAARDMELDNLRELNRKLQANILNALPNAWLPSCTRRSSSVCSSASDTSSESSRNQSDIPRSSASTISSSSSQGRDTFEREVYQKTPSTNRSSLSSDRSIESSCHENKSLSNGLNKLKDLGSFSEREASFKTPSIKRSSEIYDVESQLSHDNPKKAKKLFTENLGAPNQSSTPNSCIRYNKTESTTSDNSHVDFDTNNDSLLSFSDANDITLTSQDDNLPVKEMVEFVPGLLVEKGRLEKVEVRDLGKSEDGTYVNELAVVVFTHKTLYNSSIKERKVGSGATPRKGLDTQALAQIRSCLESRIRKEYGAAIPDLSRCKQSVVNRYIYNKIKKMRQNPKLKYLDSTITIESPDLSVSEVPVVTES